MSDLNVKEIRNKLGLTQEEFAKELGVALRTVQNWETGGVIPRTKCAILRKLNDNKLSSNNNEANGDNNTQIAGNANHVNNSSTLDKALDEIAEMRKLLAEAIRNNKEQADKFFLIIEKLQTTNRK